MNKTAKTIIKIVGNAWIASNLISTGVAARIFFERHKDEWEPTNAFSKYLKWMADSDKEADMVEAFVAKREKGS